MSGWCSRSSAGSEEIHATHLTAMQSARFFAHTAFLRRDEGAGAEGEGEAEDAVGEVALWGGGQVDGLGGGDEGGGVRVGVEAEAGRGDVVEDDGVGALGEELGAGARDVGVGLGGEGDDEGAVEAELGLLGWRWLGVGEMRVRRSAGASVRSLR